MLNKDDIEPDQLLAIAIAVTIVVSIITHYTTASGYKTLVKWISLICLGILTFGLASHSIDKDTNNTVLQMVRSVGSHINKQNLLLMVLLIPGIPPL